MAETATTYSYSRLSAAMARSSCLPAADTGSSVSSPFPSPRLSRTYAPPAAAARPAAAAPYPAAAAAASPPSSAAAYPTAAATRLSRAAPYSAAASAAGDAAAASSFSATHRPRASAAAAVRAAAAAPPPPAGCLAALPSALCRAVSYALLLYFSFSNFFFLFHSSKSYVLTLQLLQGALNVVYCLAFLSLARQADGLFKPESGLLPLNEHLAVLEERASIAASPHVRYAMKFIYRVASLICEKNSRLSPSNVALIGVGTSLFGGALSLFSSSPLARGVWQGFIFGFLYLLYLSFRYMAQEFLSFQWDVLLLETGLLTALLSPCASPASPLAAGISLLSLRLLLFKLFFSPGMYKLTSGDSKWPSLTALCYHYYTQPLPSCCSRFLQYSRWRRLQTLLFLIIELGCPLLMLCGRSGRLSAFFAFLSLLLWIYISGNYGFFAPLAAVVSLSLLDDACVWQREEASLAALHSSSFVSLEAVVKQATSSVAAAVLCVYAFSIYVVYCLTNVVPLLRMWQRPVLEAPVACLGLYEELAPLHACNIYGFLASVTTSRLEVVVEELHTVETQAGPGLSPNLVDIWIELDFAFKPGDINRSPPWLWLGHMPRLDWRLWFVPLRLCRLLHNTLREGVPVLLPAEAAALSQQQQQQETRGSRGDVVETTATVKTAEDVFPSWWLTLFTRIARRHPDVIRLLGPQKHLDLLHAPCPRGIRVSLFDYHMRPAMGLPLAAAFFPLGIPPLTLEQHKELEAELQQWEVGSWWIRRRDRVIDLFSLRPSSSSSSLTS